MPPQNDSSADLAELRRRLRRARSGLDPFARDRLDRQIHGHLEPHAWLHQAATVAVYLSDGNEPDLDALIDALWQHKQRVVLPGLPPFGRQLRFLEYRPGSRLRQGRFGLWQPQRGGVISPRHIDLVLLPLVGFDPAGNRIGQGGGFYDRSFAFRREPRRWRHPKLVGVAYDLQRVASLPRQPWDVPLDAVVTDTGWEYFT